MAAAAPETAPTFNWTGMGRPEGAHIHYQSFNFAGQHYSLGDCVYLLPEEEGSPPYIARLVRAYEDANAKEAERLVIEVQWFERRGSLPAGVSASMHELEVVESDLLDTNLVGCLDSKATIIQANSYEEACAMLPQGHTGEWHFCRGVWETEKQTFKSYADYGCYAGAAFGQGAAAAMYQQYQQAALNGYPDLSDQDFMMDDDTADLTPRSGGGRGRGGRSRRSTSARATAAANVAAATAAAAAVNGGGIGYSHRPGIPGKVCCECGATQTPQWREGPKGPKTLCNACGVRYQRQQSKAKSNKRQAADRGSGKERGSSPAPHGHGGGGRGNKAARLAAAAAAAAAVAASAENTPDAAAAAAAAVDDAFSAAAFEAQQLQQLQMAQLLNGSLSDPAAAAAAPAHHHGTRRNSKAALAAAVAGDSPRSGAGSRGRRGSGGAHNSNADTAAAGGGSSGGGGTGHGGKGAKGPSPLGPHASNSSSAVDAAAVGAGGVAGGKAKGHGHPALAAAVAAAGEQLGYYADERSPPNSNTRILEYDEQEDPQQHQGQQNLARSNTHEAADALQDLGKPSKTQQQRQQQLSNHAQQDHQQQQSQQGQDLQQQHAQLIQQMQAQQQQHAAAAAAAAAAGTSATVGFFSALGSPATALLIAEQGMPSDSMPLLSLDDKYRPGTPSGLGVNDGLDGINPHSLSPLKPRTAQQLLSGSAAAAAAAAAGNLAVGRDGSTTSMPRYGGMGVSGPGAVCASPGRLISAMVQNLKLPAPLALHPGLSPLGAVTTLGMPSGNLSQQQQHQPHGGMLSDLLAGTGTGVSDSEGGSRQQQQAGDGNGSGSHVQQQLDMEGVAGVQDGNDNRLLTQLRGLLYRASSYAPDVSGLSGLYPGPSTPRSLQQLVDQLEGLPDSSKAQLQQVSAAIEDSLSKAKAAEAAVLAVTQVLATKQAAEAEAKASVEAAVLQLRTVLSQLHPDVAAAAAGNGRGFGSAAATPTAADAAATAVGTAAAASDGMPAMVSSSAVGGYLRQSGYPLSNGAGGMLGLAEGVGVGHPYGPAVAIAQGPMTMADTDDLLRDPDDVPAQLQQAVQQLKQETAGAGDGVLGGCDLGMQDIQQQDGAVKQEVLAAAAANGGGADAAAAPVAAAAAAPTAAESAPVAA